MTDATCRATLEIVNKLGLHARAAVLLVQASARYDAKVTVSKDGQEVDGRSIMGVMMLAAEQGSADDVLNHLRQRKCEVGVLRLPFSAAPDMDFQALHCEQLFVVAGARSKWTRQRRIGLPDLVEEPWIQSYLEMEPGSPIIEAFRAAGLERPRAIVLSNSVNLRCGLLATGGFLTMFPDSLLRYGPRRAPIRVLPINLPRWHVPTSVVTPPMLAE